jgi:hypothetical protein
MPGRTIKSLLCQNRSFDPPEADSGRTDLNPFVVSLSNHCSRELFMLRLSMPNLQSLSLMCMGHGMPCPTFTRTVFKRLAPGQALLAVGLPVSKLAGSGLPLAGVKTDRQERLPR